MHSAIQVPEQTIAHLLYSTVPTYQQTNISYQLNSPLTYCKLFKKRYALESSEEMSLRRCKKHEKRRPIVKFSEKKKKKKKKIASTPPPGNEYHGMFFSHHHHVRFQEGLRRAKGPLARHLCKTSLPACCLLLLVYWMVPVPMSGRDNWVETT